MNKRYEICAWIWDGKEYVPQGVFESDSLQETQEKFNEMQVSIDCPKIDLYDNGEDDEDECILLDYKET